MNTKTQSDTPLTDFKAYGGEWEAVVSATFARTLERELNEARDSIVLQTDAITQLRAALAAKDREIERLNECLTAYGFGDVPKGRDDAIARAEKAEAALKWAHDELAEIRQVAGEGEPLVGVVEMHKAAAVLEREKNAQLRAAIAAARKAQQ